MATPVFKHQDDDGSLSVFASGDIVVFACENGHFWVMESKEQSSESVRPMIEAMATPDEAEILLRAF